MNTVRDAKRIVVKIGSSTLTYENGSLNLRRMEKVARILSDFVNAGKQVVLVTSAAVAAGRNKMGLDHKPYTTEEKQAMAAVGQCELMSMYERFFAEYGHTVAQVLITRDTYENATARKNATNTLQMLLKMGVVPIVNENDTVSFEEIEFGDNDTLSACVAILVSADVLINLSDIDGLYDSDPHPNPSAKLSPTVEKIDDHILAMAGGAGSDRGTGGVVTKLKAAEIAIGAGIEMFLINGTEPDLLYKLFEGERVGTHFLAERV